MPADGGWLTGGRRSEAQGSLDNKSVQVCSATMTVLGFAGKPLYTVASHGVCLRVSMECSGQSCAGMLQGFVQCIKLSALHARRIEEELQQIKHSTNRHLKLSV